MLGPVVDISPQRQGLEVAWQRRIQVALERDGAREAAVSLLAAGGLPVTAGVVAIAEAGRSGGKAADALVVMAAAVDGEVLAAVRRVRARWPGTRIVVVAEGSGSASQHARQALNAGADAFVPSDAADRSLAAAVHAVLAGLVCVPREARRLIAKPTFSHREKEVLALVVDGLTNREIASRLYLAESTVKTHLASAFAKLGVRSRKDAAALLLDPSEGLAAVSLAPLANR
jgi:DNA-binding NarL/FixJ family response regulator